MLIIIATHRTIMIVVVIDIAIVIILMRILVLILTFIKCVAPVRGAQSTYTKNDREGERAVLRGHHEMDTPQA